MDLDLGGKVAVVTGGSVGTGLAMAEALATEGVHLGLVARGQEQARGACQHVRVSSLGSG